MLVLFLVFIIPDWDLFRRQMFGMGSFYFSWHMLLNPFLSLLNVSDPTFWLMSVEAMGLMIVSAFIAIASSSEGARWHALRAIIMSLPYFLHGGPPTLSRLACYLSLRLRQARMPFRTHRCLETFARS